VGFNAVYCTQVMSINLFFGFLGDLLVQLAQLLTVLLTLSTVGFSFLRVSLCWK